MGGILKDARAGEDPPSGSSDTLVRIKRVFIASLELDLKEEDLDYAERLDELAGLDSAATVVFISALEKEFDVTFEVETLELGFVRDLHGLAGYIDQRASRVHRDS